LYAHKNTKLPPAMRREVYDIWKLGERSQRQFAYDYHEHNITQHFTKPRTPQTNGKAERVIRTLMEEWHRMNCFSSKDDRRMSLYAFVDWYNHERKHGSITSTPIARLERFIQVESGDNAR